METPIKVLLVVVSWKGHNNLWPELLDRGIDNMVILCGGSDYSHLDGKILHLNCKDSYEYLPEKIICAIDFIFNDSSFSSYTHILKIDDHDTYCSKKNMDNLESIHSSILNSNDYIGQNILNEAVCDYHFNRLEEGSYWYNKPYKGDSVPFAVGGSTYILSRNAMRCINITFNPLNINFVRNNFIHEDVMIGLILSAYDITPFWLHYDIRWNTPGIEKRDGIYGQWECIGIENQEFNLDIGSRLRFGLYPNWTEKKTITQLTTANIDFFEEDPVKYALKRVEIFKPFID